MDALQKQLQRNGMTTDVTYDIDPQETREWLEALDSVIEFEGSERAHFILGQLLAQSQQSGVLPALGGGTTTPYVNTIPVHEQTPMPGDPELEWRIRSYIRWNSGYRS